MRSSCICVFISRPAILNADENVEWKLFPAMITLQNWPNWGENRERKILGDMKIHGNPVIQLQMLSPWQMNIFKGVIQRKIMNYFWKKNYQGQEANPYMLAGEMYKADEQFY